MVCRTIGLSIPLYHASTSSELLRLNNIRNMIVRNGRHGLPEWMTGRAYRANHRGPPRNIHRSSRPSSLRHPRRAESRQGLFVADPIGRRTRWSRSTTVRGGCQAQWHRIARSQCAAPPRHSPGPTIALQTSRESGLLAVCCNWLEVAQFAQSRARTTRRPHRTQSL